MLSVLAQSVSYFLPSSDINFSCTQIGDNLSLTNSLSFTFPQYCLGVGLSVKAATVSTTEKNHALLYQILRIFLSRNTTKALFLSILFPFFAFSRFLAIINYKINSQLWFFWLQEHVAYHNNITFLACTIDNP